MNVQEKVAGILKEVKPGVDLTSAQDIVECGYLDSLELLALIARLSESFGIEITFEDIVPENFQSVEAISALVEKLTK